jgi:TonB family protein
LKKTFLLMLGGIGAVLPSLTHAQTIEYDQPTARKFREILVSGRDLVYPPDAVRLKQGGSGVFILFLHPDGTVKAVNVYKSTGSGSIDAQTKRTLLTYRFKPGTIRTQVFPVTFVAPRN